MSTRSRFARVPDGVASSVVGAARPVATSSPPAESGQDPVEMSVMALVGAIPRPDGQAMRTPVLRLATDDRLVTSGTSGDAKSEQWRLDH
jgi:hypothetical protein